MKNFMLILSLSLSINSYADLEHKVGQEGLPTTKELSLSRNCFQEIAELNCGHPSEDQDVFIACLHKERLSLTDNCRNFFDKLYGSSK